MREPGYIKRSPRVATNYPTSLTDSDGGTVPVVVVDISSEGCRLETTAIEIDLGDEGGFRIARIRCAHIECTVEGTIGKSKITARSCSLGFNFRHAFNA